MNVLVTGGNGFIGSALVRRLIALGHEVKCLLRESSDTTRIDSAPFARATGDVRDLASLRAAIAGCDATIHLAAPGGWQADDPALLFDVIENGTRNVLSAAGVAGRHRVIVVSSTAAVNGSDAPEVFDEESPFTLADESLTYAHAKHRAEQATRAAAASGIDAVIVNPAEVYGPGDDALGTAGNLIDFARSYPVLVCDGGTSIVHVDDVVAGIIAALNRGRAGERYILGGENLTIRELAELVVRQCNRRVPVVGFPRSVVRSAARAGIRMHLPLPFNPHVVPYATRYWFVNNAKARRDLGVDFRDAASTIGSTLDWLRATGRLS